MWKKVSQRREANLFFHVIVLFFRTASPLCHRLAKTTITTASDKNNLLYITARLISTTLRISVYNIYTIVCTVGRRSVGALTLC